MFRWQTQPYCNVLTLTVAQQDGVYTDSTTNAAASHAPRSRDPPPRRSRRARHTPAAGRRFRAQAGRDRPIVTLLLMAVGLMAAWLPRATKINP
jgi:hypothetical protein